MVKVGGKKGFTGKMIDIETKYSNLSERLTFNAIILLQLRVPVTFAETIGNRR